MTEITSFPFNYFCYVCGNAITIEKEVPMAPKIANHEVQCEHCGDQTNILVTRCPECKEGVRYFLSDLDFKEEISRLSGAYVNLIKGIKKSLENHIDEFNVPLPKKWSVNLSCNCGKEYTAEIRLPQLE